MPHICSSPTAGVEELHICGILSATRVIVRTTHLEADRDGVVGWVRVYVTESQAQIRAESRRDLRIAFSLGWNPNPIGAAERLHHHPAAIRPFHYATTPTPDSFLKNWPNYLSMECRNCELRQRQFFCRTCIKTHLRDFQSQHTHYSTDLSSVVSSATAALGKLVEPARLARARVVHARGRIDEIAVGLGDIKRECEKKRDKVRKLREDLAQRRRTLGAARMLFKANPASPAPTMVPSTPVSAPFLSTPTYDTHHGHHHHLPYDGPPLLPPSPAHLALTQTLARARSGLVQELVDVFNIVEVGGRPPVGGKAGSKGEWTIGGLILPVPGDIRRYPPDHVNAVLSLTVQFLSLLSFYLGIKLPFEVGWTGGKVGLGQPWIGAIKGGSAGGGDGGWSRWHKKHPLHLSGQAASPDSDRPHLSSSQSNTSSSDDEDPMASSIATLKPTSTTKPTLPPIKTSSPLANSPATPRARTMSAHTNAPSGPSTPAVHSPIRSASTPTAHRRPSARTYSLTSALAGVGGAVRKGVGGVVSAGAGVVSAGAGVVGYAAPSRLRTVHSGALDESAFMVGSPPSETASSSSLSSRREAQSTATSTAKKQPVSSSSKPSSSSSHKPSTSSTSHTSTPHSTTHHTPTPTHLSPSTAPPSFTTGYTMLIYNVCYLAHTQKVVPEIGLSNAGEVLSNLWRCCCSAELGRGGHESVGWVGVGVNGNGNGNAGIPGWGMGVTSPVSPGGDVQAQTPLPAGAGGEGALPNTGTGPGPSVQHLPFALTLTRLPAPTPPTFAMDFGQLLQAVSGAGVRERTKVARRTGEVYSESRMRESVRHSKAGDGGHYSKGKDSGKARDSGKTRDGGRMRDSVAELDSEEGWGPYDDHEPESAKGGELKDDWDLVDEEGSL